MTDALRGPALALMLLLAGGCAAAGTASAPSRSQPAGTPPAGRQQAPPGDLAALEITEEARLLLEEGRTGDAIRLLERAVNLHPESGRSWYWLAEAWIARGDYRQAAEFSGIAETYLEGEREWEIRARRQRIRIERALRH